jgi:hypothetical protein
MEGFGGQHFSNPALECEAAIGTSGVGRRPGSLGAKIVELAIHPSDLTVKKSPTIPEPRVIFSKLIAVVAHGQQGFAGLELAKGFNEIGIADLLGI